MFYFQNASMVSRDRGWNEVVHGALHGGWSATGDDKGSFGHISPVWTTSEGLSRLYKQLMDADRAVHN